MMIMPMIVMMMMFINTMIGTYCKAHEVTITVSVIADIVIVKSNNAKLYSLVFICSL